MNAQKASGQLSRAKTTISEMKGDHVNQQLVVSLMWPKYKKTPEAIVQSLANSRRSSQMVNENDREHLTPHLESRSQERTMGVQQLTIYSRQVRGLILKYSFLILYIIVKRIRIVIIQFISVVCQLVGRGGLYRRDRTEYKILACG